MLELLHPSTIPPQVPDTGTGTVHIPAGANGMIPLKHTPTPGRKLILEIKTSFATIYSCGATLPAEFFV